MRIVFQKKVCSTDRLILQNLMKDTSLIISHKLGLWLPSGHINAIGNFCNLPLISLIKQVMVQVYFKFHMRGHSCFNIYPLLPPHKC